MTSDQASGQPRPLTGFGTDGVLHGRYRLTRRLGRGGMADVWAAEDTVLGRTVAIKLFRFDTPGVSQERIDAEMRTIAQLSHPGIVNVYDAGTAADPSSIDGIRVPYLVMELVNGQTLADRLTRGPLSEADARELGAQLGDTLGYLHRRGVVHRDIKPANILLQGREGAAAAVFRARLTDFGVARLVDSTRITEVGKTIGTANYLSPEQAAGAPAGPPSDIYSLGLVLLEVLTGQLAYPGSGVTAAAARLHRPPHVPDTLDAHWVMLLTAMTATDPEKRPDANDVAAQLTQSSTPRPAAERAVDTVRPDSPTPSQPTRVISGWTTVQPSATRQLPTPAGEGPLQGRRSRRGWWSKPAVWLALLAGVIVVVAAVVLATEGGDHSPVPQETNRPSYPAVSGQVGQHLRHLEDLIG